MHKFASIIASVYPERACHTELRSCPDIWVAKASHLVDQANEEQLRMPANRRPASKAVILVLESPHTEEFKGQLSPAKGTTGRSIAKHLQSIPGLEKAANQPLILVNAVQYQCSLGKETKLYRDAIFAEYWEQEGRNEFIQRLQALYRPGDTLVCACTRGNFKSPKDQLRQRVWKAMHAQNFEVDILRRNHPCTWNFPKNRQYEWAAT